MTQGRNDAPYLFVFQFLPSPGLLEWLWRVAADVGIRKTDVRVVTMINGLPSNKKPSKDQIRSNSAQFRTEMRVSRARVVVPFGGEALEATTGHRVDINDARGYLIPKSMWRKSLVDEYVQFATYKNSNKKKGIAAGDPRMRWQKMEMDPALPEGFDGYVIPSYTLEHIQLEGFSLAPALTHDLDRAKRAVEGAVQPIDTEFTFFDSFDSGESIADYTGPVLAMDIETLIDSMDITDISMSDGVRTHSLPWTEESRLFTDRQIRLAYERGATVVFHNGPFDIPRLQNAGVTIPDGLIYRDTMMNAVLLQPDLPKGLGKVASIYLDLYPWKWDSIKDADARFYSAKDSFVTARLERVLTSHTEELGMTKLFMGGEGFPGPGMMPTIRELMSVTAGGIKTDRAFIERWCDELRVENLQRYQKWTAAFPGISVASNKDLGQLLYSTFGLPIQKTLSDGAGVNELAMIRLREHVRANPHSDPRCVPELFDEILAIRRTAKLLGTYALPAALKDTGRVHPSYLPEAKDYETKDKKKRKGNTSTGRLAASYPNIQNQPKEARRMYIPDSPAFCFLQHDYKSAELFALAYSANDEVLLDDLKGDIHTRNAEYLNVSRATAKNVIYAGQYLAGANKVSEMILGQNHIYISPEECRRVLDGYAEKYHKLAAYKLYLIEMCQTQGYIRNPFGRIRFFHARQAPAAVDFIPQSIVADVIWCVLLPVSRYVRSIGGRLITTVHDSIVTQVPAERALEAAVEIKKIMERRFENVAPGFFLPVEIEMAEPGMSWGDIKPLKLEVA